LITIASDCIINGSGIYCSNIIAGIRITGTDNNIHMDSVDFKNDKDIFVDYTGDSSAKTNIISVSGRFYTVSAPSDYVLGKWILDKKDDERNTLMGDLEVGSGFSNYVSSSLKDFKNSSLTWMGSGGPRTRYCKNYNGSVYSSYLSSDYNMFAGLGTSNIFYVGDENPFFAIDLNLTTAVTSGEYTKITVEYYSSTGTAWYTLNTFTVYTSGDTPTEPGIYLNNVGRSIIRLDYDTLMNSSGSTNLWTTVAIDGDTRYWIRFRVNTLLTSTPVISSLKCIPSSIGVEKNGMISKYGANEEYVQNKAVYVSGTNSLRTIQVSTNISFSVPGLLSDNTTYSIYCLDEFSYPYTDTSRPMRVMVDYSTYGGVNSTDITIEIIYSKRAFGSTTYTLTNSFTETTVSKTITTLTAQDSNVYTATFFLDISGNTVNFPLYIRIGRSNSYAGNLAICDVRYGYYKIR
jgi:hypothetical protein